MSLYSSNLIILFPVGCCLYIAMRLADARADSQSGNATRAIIYTLVSLMVSLSIAGLLLRVGPLNLLWFVGFSVVGGIVLAKSLVVGRTAMLLSFISMNENSHPARMASDFARLNSGSVSRRAKKLRRELATGKNLITALESTRIPKTEHEILWCRLVGKYGPTASQELPSILHPLKIQTEIERLMARLMVLPWLLQGVPIVIAILVYVLPTIQELAALMNLNNARSTPWVAMLDQTMEFPLNLAFSALALLGLALSGLIVLLVAIPQLVHVFPFRVFFSAYHRANGLIGLTAAGRRESDLSEACRVASQLVPSAHFSRRFEIAADRLAEGASPQLALTQSYVLTKHEAMFMQNSITAGSLAWGLEQIAVAQTEQMLRRLSVFIQAAVVLLVLVFAALYGFISYVVMHFISQTILQVAQ